MNLLDVNVVVGAFRPDQPAFAVARPWLDREMAARQPFAVVDAVAGSFVRLVTNRRVFDPPTPLADAFGFLAALRGQRHHVLLAPGARHLDLLERVCVAGDATGELVVDAQLAALALEHGAEVISFDRDFARFEGVRWSRPTAAA